MVSLTSPTSTVTPRPTQKKAQLQEPSIDYRDCTRLTISPKTAYSLREIVKYSTATILYLSTATTLCTSQRPQAGRTETPLDLDFRSGCAIKSDERFCHLDVDRRPTAKPPARSIFHSVLGSILSYERLTSAHFALRPFVPKCILYILN